MPDCAQFLDGGGDAGDIGGGRGAKAGCTERCHTDAFCAGNDGCWRFGVCLPGA